jgi:hypothetical protein
MAKDTYYFDSDLLDLYKQAGYARPNSPGVDDHRLRFRRKVLPTPINSAQRVRKKVITAMAGFGLLNIGQTGETNVR